MSNLRASILVFRAVAIDLDHHIRADDGAIDTACAIVVVSMRGRIAYTVGFLEHFKALFGADRLAQAAVLALTDIDDYLACYFN